MRIALTGATGFIGRHVVSELDRLGHRPTLLVRAGRDLPAHFQGYRAVALDFGSASPDVFSLADEPELLIHLAWGGLPNYHALHHFEQELPLQYRFLRAMVDGGLKQLVATGTCLEYGQQSGALAEDTTPQPGCAYALAKDTLRRQLEHLREARPFSLTWARLFYSYGEGQADGALWPSLRRAVARGDASFPMSGGEQLRDYLAVGAVARVLVALALSGGNPGVVNVCSGQPISVRRLVESWLAESGWHIRLDLGAMPYAAYEPLAFWGDRRKLDGCLTSTSP